MRHPAEENDGEGTVSKEIISQKGDVLIVSG
jgi:hypothetical protein